MSARVIDLGDNNEGDVSAPAHRGDHSQRRLPWCDPLGQVAADVDFDNSAPSPGWRITASTGSQLKQMVTLGTADSGDDELSIVITGLPGRQRTGLTFDFVNGEYLIKLPGGLDDPTA